MAAIELKRYHVKPGCWDECLAVLRRIVEVRKRYGFRVLFAVLDREQNLLTWAIEHDGDFDEVAKAYYVDPERVELEIIERYVTDYEIRKVEAVPLG